MGLARNQQSKEQIVNQKQATAWVAQELGKVQSREQAQAHLQAYEKSCKEFFASPAGIAAEKRDPLARKARHDLATSIRRKFA